MPHTCGKIESRANRLAATRPEIGLKISLASTLVL
jgi:hypothetical protein